MSYSCGDIVEVLDGAPLVWTRATYDYKIAEPTGDGRTKAVKRLAALCAKGKAGWHFITLHKGRVHCCVRPDRVRSIVDHCLMR